MKISDSTAGEVRVLQFEGNLDTGTSPDAQDHIDQLVDGGAAKILIDFAETEFVSSAGLRVLLATTKKLKATGGSLRICNLNETVNEVFEISGFSTILSVFPSKDEALQDF